MLMMEKWFSAMQVWTAPLQILEFTAKIGTLLLEPVGYVKNPPWALRTSSWLHEKLDLLATSVDWEHGDSFCVSNKEQN